MKTETKVILEWKMGDGSDHDWHDICDAMTGLMQKNLHKGWKAVLKAGAFVGKKISGKRFFRADTGKELFDHVLPEDQDSYFKIHRHGKGLAINFITHDSPCWDDWIYITPCKMKA